MSDPGSDAALQGGAPPAPHLSLVIPAYNEGKRLGVFLPPVLGWLASSGLSHEVVIVDDGSRDDTAIVAGNLARDWPVRLIRQPRNLGKGAAIRRGMLEAVGEIRVFSDADFSAPIEELPKLFEAISRGADVAFGSRGMAESQLEVRQPLFRELSGRLFNLMVRLLLLPGVRDSQCGFKAFTRAAAVRVFPLQRLDGFAFDVEVLMLAKSLGFQLSEVPVRWLNDPASKVSMIRGLQGFVDLVRLRWSRPSIRGNGRN